MRRRLQEDSEAETLVRVGGTIMAAGASEIARLTQERDRLQAQLDAQDRDLCDAGGMLEARDETVSALTAQLASEREIGRLREQILGEAQAQLAAERQGAIAREQALEETRELLRRWLRRWLSCGDGPGQEDFMRIAEATHVLLLKEEAP